MTGLMTEDLTGLATGQATQQVAFNLRRSLSYDLPTQTLFKRLLRFPESVRLRHLSNQHHSHKHALNYIRSTVTDEFIPTQPLRSLLYNFNIKLQPIQP